MPTATTSEPPPFLRCMPPGAAASVPRWGPAPSFVSTRMYGANPLTLPPPPPTLAARWSRHAGCGHRAASAFSSLHASRRGCPLATLGPRVNPCIYIYIGAYILCLYIYLMRICSAPQSTGRHGLVRGAAADAYPPPPQLAARRSDRGTYTHVCDRRASALSSLHAARRGCLRATLGPCSQLRVNPYVWS